MSTPSRARLPLTERSRPERLSEMVGNPQARSDLRSWAERWREGVPEGHRVAMLIGPPGVGKTTAAAALAREFGWAFVEMNASDARNQSAIEQVAGRASVSRGLDSVGGAHGTTRTLILLDEADCLSGRASESSRPSPEPLSLREFLRRRYTAVDALNASWGLSGEGKLKPFADWDSVPRSPGRSAWSSVPTARRDIEEWRAAGVVSDVSDRGGLGAIAKLVRSTRQPILLTVNDDRPLTRYSPVFRTGVSRIRFYPIRDPELGTRLVSLARSERIALGPGVLEIIVGRARGDLRAALNDLEAVGPLPAGPLQRDALGARDLSSELSEFTGEVLSHPRYYRNVEIQERLGVPPDDLLPWIEENIDRFSSGTGARADAFRVLAVADLFLHRARRARVWGLWSYASELLSGGVGLATRERSGGFAGSAQFPRFLGDMGRTRAYRALRKAVALKVGHRFHLSESKSTLYLLPFVEGLLSTLLRLRGDGDAFALARGLVRELGLTSEELTYLLGDAADADRVEALLEASVAEEAAPEVMGSPPADPNATGGSPPTASRRAVQRSLGEFGRG